ncbi:MAG: hypothetical protein MZU95_16830 [Desulfomicrobium escambiense]|nr:hypothetical protein [Desulfomicrobium escambiense]
MFADNSGGIEFDENYIVSDKVETHNSPERPRPVRRRHHRHRRREPRRHRLRHGRASPIANRYGFCFARPLRSRPALPEQRSVERHALARGGSWRAWSTGVERGRQLAPASPRRRASSISTTGTRASRWSSSAPSACMPQNGERQALVREEGDGRRPHRDDRRHGWARDGIHGATFSSEALCLGEPGNGRADRRPHHPEEALRRDRERGARPGLYTFHHRQRRRRPFLLGGRDGPRMRRLRGRPRQRPAQVSGPRALADLGQRVAGAHDPLGPGRQARRVHGPAWRDAASRPAVIGQLHRRRAAASCATTGRSSSTWTWSFCTTGCRRRELSTSN